MKQLTYYYYYELDLEPPKYGIMCDRFVVAVVEGF